MTRAWLVVVLAACPGTPAQKVQPSVPTVGTADPTMQPPSIEACKGAERHDLMVIDWTPEARGDLEVAMKQGLAVVAYDCKTIRMVACQPEGSYAFIGTTRRDKKIEMNNADEVAANLPVGGLSWLSDVGGKLDRERALLAQLTMIGKRTTAAKRVEAAALKECAGATHYVRAATVGAFAVAAGSKADLAASATVLGKGAKAESKASTKITAQDGDLEACAKSTSDAKVPPDQCGAVVRVELEPVGAVQAPGVDSDLVVATCAAGFAMADGQCVRLDKPHQCKPGDAADCTKQCDAGNAASCATLAVMHRDGAGAAKDPAKAAALGKKACDKDVAVGCRVAGGIDQLTKACDAGDGAGCVALGIAKLADKKSAEAAQYAFRRACYGGGEVEGCTWLGTLYAEGKGGMNPSPKVAAQFFEKGCKEGSAKACDGLGDLYKAGKGVAKDAAKAKALFAKACTGGLQTACKKQ